MSNMKIINRNRFILSFIYDYLNKVISILIDIRLINNNNKRRTMKSFDEF